MTKNYKILPGGIYHIFNRGNNKRLLFYSDENYDYFVSLMDKHLNPYGNILAYVLLPNHFHIVVDFYFEQETDSVYLPQKLSNFFNAYAKAFNKQHGERGSLFQSSFKRSPIKDDDHLRRIISYVHWNPEKHKMVKDYKQYPHSSYPKLESNTDSVVNVVRTLEVFQGFKAMVTYHQAFINMQ